MYVYIYIYVYFIELECMWYVCIYIYMYPCMHIYIHNKVCIHLCMHKYCTQCKLGVHILSILEVARNDLGLVQSHAIPLWAAGWDHSLSHGYGSKSRAVASTMFGSVWVTYLVWFAQIKPNSVLIYPFEKTHHQTWSVDWEIDNNW